MSVFIGGLSKLLISSLAITGIAVPVTQIVNSTKQSTLDMEETTEPINKKSCTVFLISSNNNYTVMYCVEANSQKEWYLFNKNKYSLDRIEGLTSKNNPKVSLSSSLKDWEEKEWSGFKKYDTHSHRAKESLKDTFKIHYKSKSAFPFPFFEYFKGNGCLTTFNTYIRSDMPVKFSCSSFDVPVKEFEKSLKQSDYQRSFSLNEAKKCYAQYKSLRWREVSCQNEMFSKQ